MCPFERTISPNIIFWSDSDSVKSVVNEKVLPSDKGGELVVGETVKVKDVKNIYTGQIEGISK